MEQNRGKKSIRTNWNYLNDQLNYFITLTILEFQGTGLPYFERMATYIISTKHGEYHEYE